MTGLCPNEIRVCMGIYLMKGNEYDEASEP